MRYLPLLLLAGCAQIAGITDPVGDACSPFQVSTCDQADTCDVAPDSGLLACRPEGGLLEYALCDNSPDTCGGALTCLGGVCRHFCDANNACTRTSEGECLWNDTPTAKVCDDACDVFAGTGCRGTLECHPDVDSISQGLVSICSPPGYFGDLAQGQTCTFLGQCAVGLGCDDGAGGTDTCLPLCHHDGTDCAGTCAEVGRLHETLDLGVCRP